MAETFEIRCPLNVYKSVVAQIDERFSRYGHITRETLIAIIADATDTEISKFRIGKGAAEYIDKKDDIVISPYDGEKFQIRVENSILDSTINSENTQKEMVNHPDHYQTETGLEMIDIIAACTFDLNGIEAFDTGNVVKYVGRWKKKNGLEDLKKAKWYLEHLIAHIEKIEKENV